jgi:thiamine biosynthesis protein ThiS
MQTRTDTISLQLNGTSTDVAIGTTLGALIDSNGLVRRMIAVEYNGEILPRARYDEVVLDDGDRLEVVHMVGGG